jgi:hypothetical protein
LESHYHFALDAGVRHPGLGIDRIDRFDGVYRIDWVHRFDRFDGIDRVERRHLCRGLERVRGIYRWYDGQREQHQLPG